MTRRGKKRGMLQTEMSLVGKKLAECGDEMWDEEGAEEAAGLRWRGYGS